MTTSRTYSTRRQAIVDATVSLLNSINGTSPYRTDISNRVKGRLHFFSDISDFPAVCVVAGTETRDYQSGGYRDRYLDLRVLIFVNEENALIKSEGVLEDIETIIEDNGRLAYIDRDGATQYTHDITILSLSTDEGTLEPISLGEISLRVHY